METINQQKASISAVLKAKKGKTSYYRIAKIAGLSITHVKQIEKKKAYTIDTLIKVCNALGCKLEIK